MGLEQMVEGCIAKVQSMYQAQDELSGEAKAESENLKRRIRQGEAQAAHIFEKYQQLDASDRQQYLLLEQRCVVCKEENSQMFQHNRGIFAQSLAHEQRVATLRSTP